MSAEVSERYVWYCAECGDGGEFCDDEDDAIVAARKHNRENHSKAEFDRRYQYQNTEDLAESARPYLEPYLSRVKRLWSDA